MTRRTSSRIQVMNLSNQITKIVLFAIIFTVFCFAISMADTDRNIGVCIRNCAQCSKMYGTFFIGHKCADFCVKYKGKLIPDCEDEFSIRPFLQVSEDDY